MVEHRSIVRLVRQSNVITMLKPKARVAHLSNIAFDASTWEIYLALLNGTALVCIDYYTVLDSGTLNAIFAQEEICAALLTPALLKQCLVDIPAAIVRLGILFVSGDRLDSTDATESLALGNGTIYNSCGHTENAVLSTIYILSEEDSFVNGVPIGRAISNSGAYVMDAQQRLVPIGVMGELVVTGDGLARGYTDPELDRDRFVEVEIDGQPTRAYRTGDRVRYQPRDGQIEFFGRMDRQIKIRGHRIELAEVEHAMLQQEEVSDAAVVVREREGQDVDMVGFITARSEYALGQEEGNGQVESWGQQFESHVYASIENIDRSRIGGDFVGWTSMYDGSEIDQSEMKEWLKDTMQTMLDRQPPGRVAEIGTGTGMVLFNITEGLESYVGLEPSRSAVAFVLDKTRSIAGLAGKVDVHLGTASDISRLDGLRPELVVLNSVVQYFPSPEYLFEIIDVLARLSGVQRLFFGDVRSYALNQEFLAARALHALGDRASKDEVRQKMAEIGEREEELLVDPAFFTGLRHRLPGLIKHVEILPKMMQATNELSSYRYAAVVHVRHQQEQAQAVYSVEEDAWVDFSGLEMDRHALAQLLHNSSNASIVAVSSIPYSKTILERHIIAVLDDKGHEGAEEAAWLSAVRYAAKCCPSLSAMDLVELGEQAGFRVEISWARQSLQSGGLDAIFHRYLPIREGARVMFHFPTNDEGRSLATLINRPLQRQRNQQIERQVRNGLQVQLPSYMIPGRIMVLEQMPINANGKVDRHELMQKAAAAAAAAAATKEAPRDARVPPRDDVEAAVCEECANVLGVEVGVTDNFFDLGGHSLMATRLAARISRRLDAHVSVKDIFDRPVLADLAGEIRRGSTPHVAIPHLEYSGPVELSFAQGRLWFLDRLNLGATWYLMAIAVRLRGPLRLDALNSALQALEERHESLRTTFEERDGVGVQVVHPFCRKEAKEVKVPADEALLEALRLEQTTAFDLEREPGWRVSVFQQGDEDHVLSIVMHHIISDGWSVDVLRRELATLFSAATRGRDPSSELGALPIQYRDFAVWQKQAEQAAEHERQLQYWTEQLADSHPAELLCDKPRPAVPSGEAGVVETTIEGPLYRGLQRFCKARQVTPFVVLLAAFRAAHYRLTGADDATIGTPIANRNRREVEELVGCFVNTQCMRITVEDESFEGLVQQARATVTAAFANQDVPFERVVSALLPGSRDTSRNPLVQLMFAVHSQRHLGEIHLEGLAGEAVPGTASTRFDVEFHLFQGAERLNGSVLFASELFEPETLRGMVAVFQEVLRRGLDEPQTPVALLPLIDGLAELRDRGLLEIERMAYPRDSSIVDVFHEQVMACPDAPAVKDSSTQLTYAELDRQSDVLAAWLRRRRFAAETLIGVLAPRSCQTVVAFLGILKANLAYLPLDTNTPAGRIETILSSLAGHKLVLLGAEVQAPSIQLEDVEFDTIAETLDQQDLDKPERGETRPSATSLAYVIFTSGSTGRPKGVMVEHRGVVRLVKRSSSVFQLPRAPSIAQLMNITFDLSAWEMYAALLNGGTTVCIDHLTLLDGNSLRHTFEQENVSIAMMPAALIKQYLADSPSTIGVLNLLYSGADRLDGVDAKQARTLVAGGVYNAYGPTENAILSTIYGVSEQDEFPNGVPIGRAISNSGAYVMDAQQRLVPIGVMGELVVTGDGLARGYTDPELERDRFVEVEIDGQPTRAYRTGDRVRYQPRDGQIEFFGRMDRQIKIRGHRVELAEVEHAMLQQEEVSDAAVVVREREGQGLDMVGFITARHDRVFSQDKGGARGGPYENADEGIDDEVAGAEKSREEPAKTQLERQVRDRLRTLLPSYMVPGRIMVLEQMPINANGKVDRRELTQKAAAVAATMETPRSARVPPRDEVEAAVCEECANVLGVEVGVTDNFFDLGGHSLMAMRLAARISRRLDAHVSVKDIFDRPVLADLARQMRTLQQRTVATKRDLEASHYTPFQLLCLQRAQTFVEREIAPRLQSHPRNVLDVYPVTHVQKIFLEDPTTGNLRDPSIFFIDFSPGVDCTQLERCYTDLVRRFDIFRTVFLPVAGTFYQVVLKHLQVPIQLREFQEDVGSATNALRDEERRQPFCLGHSLLRITILKERTSAVRTVFQMSHALYDGLSLEHMMDTLGALYNRKSLPAAPKFVHYMNHINNSRKEGYQYWQSLLQHSSMTTLKSLQDAGSHRIDQNDHYIVERVIFAPSRIAADGFTQATVFTSACALVLAKEAGSKDVLFGRVVSGRQCLPINYQNIMGPCTNVVPVRVCLDEDHRPRALLQQVQRQYVDSLPFETLGFDEIKENCTDWPATTENFWCNTAFRNFDSHPSCDLQDRVRLEYFPASEASIHDLEVMGTPESDGLHLRLSIVAARRSCDEEMVDRMLNKLSEVMTSLNSLLRGS